MSEEPKHDQVRSRNEPFTEKTATRIWSELPSDDNPYIAAKTFCHGYDLIELMEKRSFVDVFYLLFRGELPSKAEAQLLQSLMIALINPGPRHTATRAAMNVGVGKTDPLHILPISAMVLGGQHHGGGEIENAMRFFRKQQNTSPEEFVTEVLHKADHVSVRQAPGFGKRHGGLDLISIEIADKLSKLDGAGKAILWGQEISRLLSPHGIGWLTTGIAAATFADLGFHPRAGGCLFQLFGAPGMVAHGLELANKSITAMPFVSDENYVIER